MTERTSWNPKGEKSRTQPLVQQLDGSLANALSPRAARGVR